MKNTFRAQWLGSYVFLKCEEVEAQKLRFELNGSCVETLNVKNQLNDMLALIKDFEKTQLEVQATLKSLQSKKSKLTSEVEELTGKMNDGRFLARSLKEADYYIDYSRRLADDSFKFALQRSRAVWRDLDFTLVKKQWVEV